MDSYPVLLNGIGFIMEAEPIVVIVRLNNIWFRIGFVSGITRVACGLVAKRDAISGPTDLTLQTDTHGLWRPSMNGSTLRISTPYTN